MLFVGLTEWFQEYTANQNVIQRYATAKSIKKKQERLCLFRLLMYLFGRFTFFWVLRFMLFFQVFPVQDATDMLTGVKKAEQVLPYFIVNYLPPGISGLVIAAAAAAAMSSLDSSVNAISTIGVHDFYRRLFVKNKNDRHYLKVQELLQQLFQFL